MKKLFQYAEWRYAAFVLVLLILGGIAARLVVSSIEGHPALAGLPDPAVSELTGPVFALVAGLLFLAGAFGVWAMQSTLAIEGRRRIGRLVEDMDYLSDGMVVVNPGGVVIGMNSAARSLAAATEKETTQLRDLFPCLTEEDVGALVHPAHSCEVERVARRGHTLCSLRFRSQPSTGMSVVVISDITAATARQRRDLQISHFQLIGRLARGVAHDFNNLLCAISANVSLMDRPEVVPIVGRETLDEVLAQSQRGAELATRLIQLSAMDAGGPPAENLERHAESAADLLRVVLSPLWTVTVRTTDSFPPVPLTGNQVEQILLNLGLHAAEEMATPGELRLELTVTGWERKQPREMTVSIQALPPGVTESSTDSTHRVRVEDTGVIESVVRSVVESAGSQLRIYSVHIGHDAYQIVIPALSAHRERATAQTGLPSDVTGQVCGWRVMLARPPGAGHGDLEQRCAALGVDVEFVTDLVLVLSRMEKDFPFEAIVIDRRLLGENAEALLRAMLKLKPELGIVVLSEDPEGESSALQRDIVFAYMAAAPYTVLTALARAGELAAARRARVS